MLLAGPDLEVVATTAAYAAEQTRTFWDWAADVTGLIGGVVAALGLLAALRAGWQRTLGRRWDRYRRLSRLGTGAQLRFFSSVLGSPPAMRQTVQDHVESIYVDRDYFVQTLTDADDTVVAYSVTTRRRGFNPRFRDHRKFTWREQRRFKKDYGSEYQPAFELRLGKSTFADVRSVMGVDPKFHLSVGARTYSVADAYYLGNPGSYQTFVFSASNVTWGDWETLGKLNASVPNADVASDLADFERSARWIAQPTFAVALRHFREHTRITTYTVLGAHFDLANYPLTFGPFLDRVRTLP